MFVARCKWGAERRENKNDGVSNYYIILDVSYLVANRTGDDFKEGEADLVRHCDVPSSPRRQRRNRNNVQSQVNTIL